MGNGVGYKVTETQKNEQVTINKDGSVAYGDSSFLHIYSVTR